MEIKANTYYRTRDGRKAFVAAENPFTGKKWVGCVEDGLAASWNLDGWYLKNGCEKPLDLWDEWKEPESGMHWLNVYRSKLDSHLWYANYRTRKMADDAAMQYKDVEDCIACVEVPWTEGQGLEEGQ